VLDQPIPYRLRVSPRARGVSLRVSAERGLEVVIPQGYNPVLVPKFVAHMHDWIEGALARVRARQQQIEPDPPWQLPVEIALPSIGKRWQVTSKASANTSVSIRAVGGARLSITGTLHDEHRCRQALARWLIRQAKHELVPQLDVLSHELGLRYRRVYVRLQRARWGSCSSRKAISLNAKLLFLPPALARSVMVHELCHLAEMNHSARFWARVERYDPDFRAHRAALRDASKSMPSWVISLPA